MEPSSPEKTIWYVEASSSKTTREGSAVAIRLQKQGNPATAKTYLLTCAHVVRGELSDSNQGDGDGYGPISSDIHVWPPGHARDDGQRKKATVAVNELADGDVPVSQRNNAAKDWVVLEIEDGRSAAASPTVSSWVEDDVSGMVRIYGYLGGKASIQEEKGIVTPRPTPDDFRVLDESEGAIRLSGDGTRPGISGGGVFTADTLQLVGIHRARTDAILQLHGVSFRYIRHRLRELGFEVVEPPPERSDWFTTYISALREYLQEDKSFRAHEVDFKYSLKSKSNETVGADALCDMLVKRKFHGALILGEGGSGKSAYLGRIARRLREKYEKSFCPIVIAAGNIPTALLDDYFSDSAGQRDANKLESIFEEGLRIKSRDFRSLVEIRNLIGDRGIFFLIDGINEVHLAAREQGLFEEIIRHIGSKRYRDRCIVTARAELKIVSEHWKSFKVAKISEDDLDSVLNEKPFHTSIQELNQRNQQKIVEILRNPFFLQLARDKSNLGFQDRANLLYQHFRDEKDARGIGIESDNLLEKVGKVALELYRNNQGTWFPIAEMQDLLREEIGLALDEDPRQLLDGCLDVHESRTLAGSLDPTEPTARFGHQLKHDFLVSYYLCRVGAKASERAETPRVTEWSRRNLDAATWHTENLDPLILAVEQLEPESVALNDEFLRSVYNWHLGATIQCLAAERDGSLRSSNVPSRFSIDLRTAVLSLLADKRHDPIRHTQMEYQEWAKRVTDPQDQEFFDTSREVRDIVRERRIDGEWFASWRSIFCGDPQVLRQNMTAIAGDDEVLAWTIANAVRSLKPRSLEDAGYLSRLLEEKVGDESMAIARWRIVHAVSMFGDSEYAGDAVFNRLDAKDEYIWVRYGAGRAIVEMAALQQGERRKYLLDRLFHSVETFTSPDQRDRLRILREIGRSVLYQGVPEPQRWVANVAPLVGLISKEIQQTERYRERWLDHVLTPLREGTWIGVPLPPELQKQMTAKYDVRWGKV